ncbi:hypothetical protein DKZ29_07060 [Limosilactobacillus reuteri]|nr:hypothetical protein [Limosilactobacillus reuteri]PWT34694.1 hypothetical protein DKZ24_07565 [Limosilactobacillus reuteri]PWT55700.1 hypothetical protein DKZ31_01000 [Limosilactobacillus reuteri]PWT57981.1 hypothetical protein DKZ29_07060 [Limosilactobacillus reuteri]PWT58871.1 hypothetical protein DKZ30_07210 [Limosilactobacillus reuteri]PWT65664.1 hypothetical protein DKZ28_07575 [Limosilactobacillus reuteri]
MTQPILNQASNYDAKNSYTFTFTYLGAEHTTTNTLSIREDGPGTKPVYEKDQVSLDKNHILLGTTLNNGTAYLAKVRVKLKDGYSEWSPEIKFTCYTTPRILFDTIDQHQFIYTNDVLMSAIYTQAQNEPVTSYQYTLYDQRHVALVKYPIRKPERNSPTRFSERVSNIKKGKLYYIGLKVVTEHGIIYEQLQEFTAQYITPSVSGIIQPTMNKDDGQIVVDLFLKQLLGTSARAYIPKRKNDNADNYTYWKDDYVFVPKENPLIYTKLAMAKASDWIGKFWVMNVQNGLFLDFSPAEDRGQHIKFYKHDDYITCEKEFGQIKSRTRSNVIKDLKLRPFYMFVYVKEYRVEIKIVPDQTFKDDDWNEELSREELSQYGEITKETQQMIDAAEAKINAARQRLQQIHDEHWQQYITKVEQAISDARARILGQNELRDRVMEIDDQYWDYFENTEMINYWKELAKAERESEAKYEIYRTEYEQRINDTLSEIKSGAMTLDDGRLKLTQYSLVYSFILREVIDFNDTKLTLDGLQELYNDYLQKYK